ncbi:MAG: hypothetical protein A2504_11855 [Bdellovibrionales bacterium RIFOXYD12_FULL_39_22]|nr:MAG: hypothetical protein A2385_16370 [Bdellovibrionales bacterium RIFOXYB1_FULL_39_21]OFZ44468.1 MAG: hypothetical protein A2485_06525 [Bdellovibrionales bacterium RIFOXYC12_FULL_39_17]OFZ49890.1 MAG: hypothetical protein A2404_00940 [Bdellovibrionales bacterium RIFOXYC1_FULL_39_130]OFZ76895.1 MAG: hypothetical protein A2560_05740 [Bdellovibrionales bacterium RIFOXYD1_FULL_39_84]OFZ95822.1 MAG: hypothetical protein A2504_11855 [Bdellovibrionales bacterium RIFOXYD12_FULL_39_22]HLE10842.1 gl
MKVALLANAQSIHTCRWANGLAANGIDVHVISCHPPPPLPNQYDAKVQIHILPFYAPFGYFSSAISLRSLLKMLRPDILNAHYATGYGLLARLCRFKPLLLSVWGSDIYDFPNKSSVHKWFLKGNLKNATAIASTSNAMAKEMAKTFAHDLVFITPFGIDEKLFAPQSNVNTPNKNLTIGTVKTLEHKYGIDTLLHAFAKAQNSLQQDYNLKLLIAGDGPQKKDLLDLAARLGISDHTTFLGKIPHEQVPSVINQMDLFVALSRKESFGVAILEASACQKAVVVSNADGPAEVTIDNVTGIIVKTDDQVEASAAITKLIRDETLRNMMGINGRKHVLSNYTWSASIDSMARAYLETIAKFK